MRATKTARHYPARAGFEKHCDGYASICSTPGSEQLRPTNQKRVRRIMYSTISTTGDVSAFGGRRGPPCVGRHCSHEQPSRLSYRRLGIGYCEAGGPHRGGGSCQPARLAFMEARRGNPGIQRGTSAGHLPGGRQRLVVPTSVGTDPRSAPGKAEEHAETRRSLLIVDNNGSYDAVA